MNLKNYLYCLTWLNSIGLQGLLVVIDANLKLGTLTLNVYINGGIRAGMNPLKAVFIPLCGHLGGEGEAAEACRTEAQQALGDDATIESTLC